MTFFPFVLHFPHPDAIHIKYLYKPCILQLPSNHTSIQTPPSKCPGPWPQHGKLMKCPCPQNLVPMQHTDSGSCAKHHSPAAAREWLLLPGKVRVHLLCPHTPATSTRALGQLHPTSFSRSS